MNATLGMHRQQELRLILLSFCLSCVSGIFNGCGFSIEAIHRVADDCVTDATPVVKAIGRYRETVGLWPQTLDELVPEYLTSVPGPEQNDHSFRYGWAGYEIPPEVRMNGAYHMRVIYFFPKTNDDPDQGWHITIEGDRLRKSRPDAVRVDVDAPFSEEMRTRMISELKRRATSQPDEPRHREQLQRLMLKEKQPDQGSS